MPGIDGLLYKAYGKQGATALIPTSYAGKIGKVQYVTDSGKVYSTQMQTEGSQETGAYKFNFGASPEQLGPGKVQLILDDGTVLEQPISNSTNDFRNGKETAPQNQNSGPGGVPGQFSPGSIGYGSVPAYLGGEYPSPVFSQFNPVTAPNIKSAPYQFIDPAAFATSFGALNRAQYVQNASLSKDIALDQLDTELQGLTGYAPAAAALKRAETANDNAFNQGQRTQQIDSVLPNARGDLEAQRRRANAYASGRAPDEITDRSLELGVRSAAADNANAGGFGTGSVAASNLSNTMSAERRLQLAQYGESLISSNLKDATSTLLAPLEYSTAGTQISVMPSLSGSQLASKALTDLNALTTIDPTNALNSSINQNQFASNLVQRTNEFNANLESNTSQFNANGLYSASANNAAIANQFSLGKFAYDVTYAGAAAGAAQLNTNTNLSLQQQAQYQQIFSQMMANAQNAQQASSISQLIGAALPILSSLFSGSSGGNTTATGGSGGSGTATPTSGSGSSSGSSNGANAPTLTPAESGGNTGLPAGTTTDKDGSIILPNGTPMPEGYHATQTVDGGQVIAPGNNPSLPPEPDGFHYETNDTGDGFILTPDEVPSGDPVVTGMEDDGIDIGAIDSGSYRTLQMNSKAVDATMGVTSKPIQGSVLRGYTDQGKPTYSNVSALKSQDNQTGSRTVTTLQQMLQPLNVFKDRKDANALTNVADVAGDVAFAAKLTDLYQRGDRAGFANALVGKFGANTLSQLGVGKSTIEGLSTAFNAYNLYNQWGQLSPAQKSMGIASMGLQAYKTVSGTDLGKTPIIAASPGNPGLNVGQALGLFQAGVNVYNLANNWNQLNTVQKIAAGSGTTAQIAQLAQSFGLLGKTGSAAAGSTGAASGGTAAATSDVVAGLSSVAGAAGVGAGALQVYNSWGKGGKQNTINGALGGAAMAGGLYALGATNPFVLGGIVAASALGANVESKESQRGASIAAASALGLVTGGAIFASSNVRETLSAPFKSGKSEEQVGRDAIRDYSQKVGLADKDYQMTLADGTKADIGADGKSGSFKVSNPDKWVGGKAPSSLHSYDTDYTNDLDYTAALGGIALSRLSAGGKSTPIDQVGAQMGNALLQNIGHGQQFTPQNFNKLMENQRAVFSQRGIKSKQDAYAVAQAAFKEGRIDATDLVGMQQSFNMMYDKDGYMTAQRLMQGRWRGIEVAATDPAPKSDLNNPTRQPTTVSLTRPSTGSSSAVTPVPRGGTRVLTKTQIAANNKAKFGNSNLFQLGAD